MRNRSGIVQACLTTHPKSFPGCQKDPGAIKLHVPADQAGHLHFVGVQPGIWALALVHDENGNGKMDMALFLPKEGVGVSRNPPTRMGPPTFESAAFKVAGEPVTLSVTMKYML